ncbi:MAG: HTH-type transcriptional repressor KstR2 [Syntrophorhabdaceae bacterium PtaU1.Bin034]|nr:MAG: HTH-type transcriptional repressor KstR2 [Syntrophorhabdaceae bacterium PtaU1.Bin034]
MGQKRKTSETVSEDKRAFIERKAADLFSRKSYVETSLKDIADAANLSKGGIYHYFATKDEVLYSILDGFMEKGISGLEEDLKAVTDSRSRLRTIVEHIVEHYVVEPSAAKTLLYDLRLLPDENLKAIGRKQRRYLELTVDALNEFFGGKLKADELTTIAFVLMGMCTWVFTWYNPKGPISAGQLSDIIYNIFVSGIEGISPNRGEG